jgi:hypothetical protein
MERAGSGAQLVCCQRVKLVRKNEWRTALWEGKTRQWVNSIEKTGGTSTHQQKRPAKTKPDVAHEPRPVPERK